MITQQNAQKYNAIIYTVMFHPLKVSLYTNPFYHGLMQQQQQLEDIVV